VVVGRLDVRAPAAVEEMRRHVEAGGSLLVVPEPDDPVAADLTGVRVDRELARAEWFVTLGHGPEAARLDREVPVSTPLHVLHAVGEDVKVRRPRVSRSGTCRC
jgi:hypothetical protein